MNFFKKKVLVIKEYIRIKRVLNLLSSIKNIQFKIDPRIMKLPDMGRKKELERTIFK